MGSHTPILVFAAGCSGRQRRWPWLAWLALIVWSLTATLWAGNAGPAPGPVPPPGAGGNNPAPPPTVPPSGGKYVNFQVSVFPPYQDPGIEIKDPTESMGDLAGGKAYFRRGYYLPLVVNFYNQDEEFDVVVQCEVNALTFDARLAQAESAMRMSYYTELHVAKGAPAEQSFSILMPSDQPMDNPSLMVYIRPKGGIQGYDRKILLDDIDKPTVDHPGLKGSRLVLALTQDPASVKAFPRWERYLKGQATGAINTNNRPDYENIIFTRPKKGFMVKYVPPDWYALSMVNMMLIDRTPQEMTWTEQNRETVLQWVRGGGVLVLSGPPDQKQWEKLGLDGIAGVRVLEGAPQMVTDVSALAKAFPGGNDNDDKFVNDQQKLAVGRIRQIHDDAFSVATDDGVVLYHERRVGAGAVVVIPWNIDGVTSNGAVVGDAWGRRNAMYSRVSAYMSNPALGPYSAVNQIDTSADGGALISQQADPAFDMWSRLKPEKKDAMSDEQIMSQRRFSEQVKARSSNLPARWDSDQWLFRNYLKNSFEKQSPVKLPPTAVVAGFLLLYLFLASPLTWLVMRLLKKTEWAWPVSILLAFLFALFSYGYFYAGKQGAMVCNEVSAVELTDGDPHGVAVTWAGLYSPNRGSFEIRFPDVPYGPEEAIPLGVERAAGALMIYDRNLNLSLAKDEGRGVNITWDGVQPVMKDVYINDRSSQYFRTQGLVDFGEKAGGGIKYDLKRQSATSSHQYVVTVTNATGFDVLAPTLMLNGSRYALVPMGNNATEFRQTVIPAGAKNLELRTEGDDLMAVGRDQRNLVPVHLLQQVPKAWEDSEFLNDRTIYLNALSSLRQDKWMRGNEKDALLIGWVNAPAVFIQVDGQTLTHPTQYTGVMQVAVRKPGWVNQDLQEAYMVGGLNALSYNDAGHDETKPEDDDTILPRNQRTNRTAMSFTQVRQYGGLVNFWYQRNAPYRPGTQKLVFRAPIDVNMPENSESRRLLVNGVEFSSAGGVSAVKFTVPPDKCWIHIDRINTPGKDYRKDPVNLQARTRDQYFICFEVDRKDIERFALGEKCNFQVELLIQGTVYSDSEMLLTVRKFVVEEH